MKKYCFWVEEEFISCFRIWKQRLAFFTPILYVKLLPVFKKQKRTTKDFENID
jgi:hypothetical protein